MNRYINTCEILKCAWLALLVGLTGCIKDTSDLDVYFDEHRSKQARAIDPIPEIKPYLTVCLSWK